MIYPLPAARFPPNGGRETVAGGVGGGGAGGTGRDWPAPVDHCRGPPFVPPPPFSRKVDGMMPTAAVSGAGMRREGGIRPGISRARVRPSSASARVHGRGSDGGQAGGKTGGGIPRRLHVPRGKSGGSSHAGRGLKEVRS